jgi:Glycosyltransferases involved in cell wall biogenesis
MSLTCVCLIEEKYISYLELKKRLILENTTGVSNLLFVVPKRYINKNFEDIEVLETPGNSRSNQELKISNFIRTDYYLVLRPGIFCYRTLEIEDLIKDGRFVFDQRVPIYKTEIARTLSSREESNLDYFNYLKENGIFDLYHVEGELLHNKSIYNWKQAFTFNQKLHTEDDKKFFYFNLKLNISAMIIEDIVDFKYWYKIDNSSQVNNSNDLISPINPNNPYNIPLISCLMITKNRLRHVKRAVSCFLNQSYPNRELIVIEDGNDGTMEYCNSFKDSRIKVFHLRPEETKGLTLGDLRNLSIQKANGKYVICWDDDDFYHSSRIACMYKKLVQTNSQATFLSRWMMFWPERGYYAISFPRQMGWEGSMLLEKDKAIKYNSMSRGEDTVFCEDLKNAGVKIHVISEPSFHILYLYIIHGSNTWGLAHFGMLFSLSEQLRSYVPKEDIEDAYVAFRSVMDYEVPEDVYTTMPISYATVMFILAFLIIFVIVFFLLYLVYRFL